MCFSFIPAFCSSRFGVPVPKKYGRKGKTIKYIVLHQLSMTMQDYSMVVQSDINFSEKYDKDPRSLHYLVNGFGAIQSYVKDSDAAWGINKILEPTVNLYGETENSIDNICLHVGVEFGGLTEIARKSLSKIVCCLINKHSLTSGDVILAININEDQDNLTQFPDLTYDLEDCENIPNPPVDNPNQTVPECCEDNAAAILLLEDKITDITADIASSKVDLITLKSRVDTFDGRIAQYQQNFVGVNAQISELTRRLAALEECADCVDECKEKNCQKIHYRSFGTEAYQLITPNQPVRINFKNKVSDNTPPSVTVGPLWSATLSCPCNTRMAVNLRLKGDTYCEGKQVWVDAVTSCAGVIRLTEFSPNTTSPLQINSSAFLFAPQNCTIYFEIGTNDLFAKTLEFAEVLFECG